MSLKRTMSWSSAVVVIGVALVASAAPGDAKKLGKQLDAAVEAQDPGKVQAALTGLIEHGGAEALNPVLDNVQKIFGKGSMSIYWQLVSGASGFRDAGALRELGEFIRKKKKAPFARDLLFGLENNSSPHTIETLGGILSDKKAYDLQLMAADQLAQIHTHPSVDTLIKQLKAEGEKGDPELRRRLMSALATITGEQLGDLGSNWIDWWEVNKNNWTAKGGAEGDPDGDGDGMSGGDHSGGGLSSTMNRDRKDGLTSLQRGPKRIIVLSSVLPKDHPKKPGASYDYDHMEQILERLEIPHDVVLKSDFEKEPAKYLETAWTILVNCNNIQTQCICADCSRILGEKLAKGDGSAGGKNNRLYGCPPECSKHDQVSFRLKKETVDKIKDWVEGGGYLFTEDWGLIEIIEVAWPKLVSSDETTDANGGKGTAKVKAMDVTIVPGLGMTSRPILRGVFTKPRPPARKADDEGGTQVRDLPIDPTKPPSIKWKIDDESPSLKINSSDVDVLMRSEDLGKAMGGKDAVAVSFRAGSAKPAAEKARKDKRGPVTGGGGLEGKSRGKSHWRELKPGGRVLHVMSHFGKQQGSSEDTFVLQNMILNFIMESNRQHGG